MMAGGLHFTRHDGEGEGGESLMIISCKTYIPLQREKEFSDHAVFKVVPMLLQQHSHHVFGGHALARKHCALLI